MWRKVNTEDIIKCINVIAKNARTLIKTGKFDILPELMNFEEYLYLKDINKVNNNNEEYYE